MSASLDTLDEPPSSPSSSSAVDPVTSAVDHRANADADADSDDDHDVMADALHFLELNVPTADGTVGRLLLAGDELAFADDNDDDDDDDDDVDGVDGQSMLLDMELDEDDGDDGDVDFGGGGAIDELLATTLNTISVNVDRSATSQ